MMGTALNAPANPPPITVTTIQREGTPQTMNASTPAYQPNVIVQAVTPLASILVRSLRVFLQTMLGLMTAGTVAPTSLNAHSFWELVIKCASLSVAAAGICALQNFVELLGRLDQKFPLWRG